MKLDKLDILVFGAHPDDAELSCSGTIMAHIAEGRRVGIVDLTRGELGTRGSADLRDAEALAASKIMGIHSRENLALPDGFFKNSNKARLEVIKAIRKYRPEIILANAPTDRHPDHGRASKLVETAAFLSGLPKIETKWNGEKQLAWRPTNLYFYIQSNFLEPDFVVDISDYWTKKKEAISAYESQFFEKENDTEGSTFLTDPMFLRFIEGRAIEYGKSIGARYGEGFIKSRRIGVKSLFDLSWETLF